MATSFKRMVPGSQLTNAAATYYTVSANTKAIIKRLSFCNTTANNRTVTAYLITSGGSAGATNTLVSARTIAAGETWSCPDAEGQVLEAGGFIQALADANSAITIIASGVEVTNG